MLVSTADSVRDVGGVWSVMVSMTEDLDNAAAVTLASPMGFGLRTRAFSFQITDAVIADGPATVGSACPAPNRTADAGSTHTLVLCGSNRTTQTQTLKPRYAGLKGTFIHSHGAFSSGPVAPTDSSVVLGNWSNVKITSAVGEDMTVLARVRSAPRRSSAWKTLDGYESVGAGVGPTAPVANNDGYNINEDTTLIAGPSGVLGNDTDANSDPLTVSSVNGNAANVGTQIATTHGLVTVNADGSFTYTPDTNYHGTDSFTYTANDGALDSASGTASITIFPVNDAPTALGDSVGTTTTTPINVTAPGILDNDSDPDGDPLTTIKVSDPAHAASFTFGADGSFSYTAVSGYDGPDSFTYKVNDGTLDSNTVTVNITVNASGGGGGGGGGGGCLIVC
jgi:VCBS repeat-containing protein